MIYDISIDDDHSCKDSVFCYVPFFYVHEVRNTIVRNTIDLTKHYVFVKNHSQLK